MNILENKSTFSVDKMWSITERDGNKKRPYLLLNKLQAKYIPVHPSVTFKMFDELYDQVAGFVNNEMNGKNVIVIGFAETATAIGARIAEDIENNLNAKVTFLPTTREPYDVKPMVEFEEVHSHAVEQILYGNEELFNNADYIVFAEDEVTTGNTILNCVKKMNLNCKFIVASLLNCMDENELNNFKEYNISPVWLTKTDKEGFENLVKHSNINNEYEKIVSHFNLKKGDNIWISSELIKLMLSLKRRNIQFDGNGLINAFQEAVGNDGTILIPTFRDGLYQYPSLS